MTGAIPISSSVISTQRDGAHTVEPSWKSVNFIPFLLSKRTSFQRHFTHLMGARKSCHVGIVFFA